VAGTVALLLVAVLAIRAFGDGGGTSPPPRPLDEVRALAGAPQTQEGLRVDVQVTQSLVPAAALRTFALPAGEIRGRLWVARGDLWRLELQGLGHDWQLTREGGLLRLYGSPSQTLYALPAALLPGGLAALGPTDVAGPEPRVVAGRPAYRVRYAPRDPEVLIGAVELTTDAATGVPLEVAVRPRAGGPPVLRMRATSVTREAVGEDRVRVRAPGGGSTVPLGPVLDLAQRSGTLSVRGSGWARVLRLRGAPGGAGDLLRRLGGLQAEGEGAPALRLPLASALSVGDGFLVGAVTPGRLRREADDGE